MYKKKKKKDKHLREFVKYLLRNKVLDILSDTSRCLALCNFHHSYNLDNTMLFCNEVVPDNHQDRDRN